MIQRLFLVVAILLSSFVAEAFHVQPGAVSTAWISHTTVTPLTSPDLFQSSLSSPTSSSSSAFLVSAVTIDPTTFFNDALSGVLGTPVILLVPIVAALTIAALIAYFIISYANPTEADDVD